MESGISCGICGISPGEAPVPTHQALVSEGIVNAPDEEPEGPQVLKPELQHKICQQHQGPHHQELQVQEGAGGKEKGNFESGFPTNFLF